MVETATRGLLELPRPLGWSLVLNDLLSRGKGGNLNIDLPCQSYRTSIARARGSRIGDVNWGRCLLWTVANMSIVGVPYVLKIQFTISGLRLMMWLMLTNSVEIDSHSQSAWNVSGPYGYVCSHRNRFTARRNRVWEWVPPPPCVMIW